MDSGGARLRDSGTDTGTATGREPSVSLVDARRTLFLEEEGPAACGDAGLADAVRCLLRARYAKDEKAAELAVALYDGTGDVAGLSPKETMEGGFRGTLSLVPELPVGPYRKHLEWVASAAADVDDFFRDLRGDGGAPFPYRWRAIELRFMRSVDRTTPSAYANDWAVAYNVKGSLNTSKDAVRELLFHEMFHLNDAAHGDWSRRTLGQSFDAIVARCHASVACLAPYAPTGTLVRGGTYYAFQGNNGDAVHEYAAELAIRYFREQTRAMRGEKVSGRFKCGPGENARAWLWLAQEFFRGVDRVPPCG